MKQGRKISIVSRMFAVLLAVMMVCSNISLPSKAAETVQTIAAWEYKDKDSAPSSLPAGATSGSGQLNVTGATYTGYSSKSLDRFQTRRRKTEHNTGSETNYTAKKESKNRRYSKWNAMGSASYCRRRRCGSCRAFF